MFLATGRCVHFYSISWF